MRVVGDIHAEIDPLHVPLGGVLNLFEDRVGADAVAGRVGMKVRVDRRETGLSDVDDRDADQSAIEPDRQFSGMTTTVDQKGVIRRGVDRVVVASEILAVAMGVEQIDSGLIDDRVGPADGQFAVASP